MGSSELKVLVVDDDFRVANMHAGIVNALPGFTVTTTATTLAAARKAEPVDLALVDVYLPDGSGVDFVRELRCDSMVLSAATDAPTIRAALAAGALSYIVKPFAPADLAARLWRLCALPQDPVRNQPRRQGGGRRPGRDSSAHRARPIPHRRDLPDEGPCAGGASRIGPADVVCRDVGRDRRLEGDRAAVSVDAGQLRRRQDPAPLRHDRTARTGVRGRREATRPPTR